MSDDWHPELAADEDDERPVRGARRQRMLRVTVLVALGALLLPLVLSAYGTAYRVAAQACALTVAAFDTSANGYRAEFSLTARGGPGWLCFSQGAAGERLVANLGLLPRGPAADRGGRDV